MARNPSGNGLSGSLMKAVDPPSKETNGSTNSSMGLLSAPLFLYKTAARVVPIPGLLSMSRLPVRQEKMLGRWARVLFLRRLTVR